MFHNFEEIIEVNDYKQTMNNEVGTKSNALSIKR